MNKRVRSGSVGLQGSLLLFGGVAALGLITFACGSNSDTPSEQGGTAGQAGIAEGGRAGNGEGGKAGQSGSGAGAAGETQQGGAAQGGSAGAAQAGSAGAAQAGSSGAAQGGSSGAAQGGSSGAAQGGSSGAAQGGSSGAAQGGSSGAAQGGSSGAAQGGSSGAAQAGSSGAAQGGSSGAAQAGSSGAAQGGSSGAAQAGSSGAAQAGSGGSGGSGGAASAFLSWQNGYIDGPSNIGNVHGYWYTYTDTGTSTIQPSSFATGGATVCVFGNAAQYVGAATYGSTVGFNANQVAGTGTVANAWDATAHSVVGFRFTLTGAQVPSSIQLNVKVFGSTNTYCSKVNGVTAGNSQAITFGSVTQDCFTSTGSHPAVDATQIESIQFQIPSVASGITAFDFCVGSVQLLSGG